MTPDVAGEPQVRKVWELLLQTDPRWGDFEEHDGWGIARKLTSTDTRRPLERVVVRPSATAIVGAAAKQARERLPRFGSTR